MKKVMILTLEDYNASINNPTREISTSELVRFCAKEVSYADIVLSQSRTNNDFYAVGKDHSSQATGHYIHKDDVLKFVTGKSVRLYNRGEISLHMSQDTQSEEILVMPCENIVVNALMGMEVDD